VSTHQAVCHVTVLALPSAGTLVTSRCPASAPTTSAPTAPLVLRIVTDTPVTVTVWDTVDSSVSST